MSAYNDKVLINKTTNNNNVLGEEFITEGFYEATIVSIKNQKGDTHYLEHGDKILVRGTFLPYTKTTGFIRKEQIYLIL